MIGRHGAELILHGHNHRDVVTRVSHAAGQTTVIGICSGSASRAHHGEPLARYNLLRFRAAQNSGERPCIELTPAASPSPVAPSSTSTAVRSSDVQYCVMTLARRPVMSTAAVG